MRVCLVLPASFLFTFIGLPWLSCTMIPEAEDCAPDFTGNELLSLTPGFYSYDLWFADHTHPMDVTGNLC